MNKENALKLISLIQSDDARGFSELVPSVFPLYSFPTAYYTPEEEILKDQPPLVSICVYYGAIKCMEYMSAKGADFKDSCDDFGRDPIHFLGYAPNTPSLIKFFQRKGVDFDSVDNSDKNLLSKALEMSDPTLLKIILTQKICSYKNDTQGHSPFYSAVESGNLTSVQTLFNQYYEIVLNEITTNDDSITCAIKHNYTDIVIFLMNKQSGRESRHHINTAIHLSNMELLEYFINVGEDINEPDENGQTPLVFAIEGDQVIMVDYLLEKGADPLRGGTEMPFKAAIEVGSPEIINRLIDNLSDINALDEKGYSLLHYAAQRKPYDGYNFMKLIQNGANLSTEAQDETTPAELLVRAGNPQPIADLIKNGTTMLADGYSILHTASSYNNTEIMEMVLNSQNINIETVFGDQTPLMAAASANPEIPFPLESGDTPSVLDDLAALLDVETFQEHFKAAILLIKHGADPTSAEVLNNAIINGDPLAVFFLLIMGANPTSLYNGHTLVAEALEHGFEIIAHLLVFFGAVDDEMDKREEEMPLFNIFYQNNAIIHLSARFSPPEIVRYAIEKGGGIYDIDEEDGHGLRPVHQAILGGMMANLEVLFEYEAARTPLDITHPNLIYSIASIPEISLVPSPTPQMNYDLLYRIINTHLIEQHHENINAPDSNGKTALAIAFEKKNMRVVEVLMRLNARRDFVTGYQSFFQYILSFVDLSEVHSKPTDFTRYISRDFERQPDDDFELNGTDVNISAMVHIIVMAIKLGENIDAHLPNNETILHVLCRNNLITVVDYLVQKGANINAVDNNGQTPIHHIAIAGDCDNIERLDNIQNVHYNEVDKLGRTPFSYACQHSSGQLLGFLLEHGASVNSVDLSGTPPINYSVREGNFDSFRFLMRNEASPFASDEKRVAPIHIAAEKGLMDILYELVRIPGQLRLRDSEGNTPLHYAVRNNQLAVIRLITRDPTTISELNNNHDTPLTLAANDSNIDLVNYFFSLGAHFSPSQAYNSLTGPLSRHEYEFARQMLEHGLHPHLKSGKNSLLIWAVERKDLDTIRWLITTARVMKPIKDQDFTAFAVAYVLEYDDLCEFLAKIYPENKIPAILASFMPNLPQRIAEIRGRRSPEIHEELRKEVINFGQRYLPAELRQFIQVSRRYTMYQFVMNALEKYDIVMITDDLNNEERDITRFNNAFAKLSYPMFSLMLQQIEVPMVKDALWENNAEAIQNCLEGISIDTTQKILGIPAADAVRTAIQDPSFDVKKDVLTKLAVEMIRISDQKRKVEMMQAALEAGASPNMRDEEGNTLLHIAVLRGNLEMVKILLKYGASPNKMNKSTLRLPVDDAVRLNIPEMVQLLVAYGTNMSHFDENGNTFIHAIVASNQNELLKFILHWGVSTQITNQEGKTLLHTAIETQNAEACQILLDNYALTDVPDNNGNTPGKLAMNSQNNDITMILFSRGQRT